MENIEIYKHSEDFLQTDHWIFHFNESNGTLVLQRYYFLKKENKRKKKYQIVKNYDRLGSRSSNTVVEDVPFPPDVQEEALKLFMKKVKIVK